MPSIYDNTAHAALMKVLYPDSPEIMWYEKAPFLALVKKTYDFFGESKQTNPIYDGHPGSSSFSAAMEEKANTQHTKFNVTRKKQYVLFEIDGETMATAEEKKGAIAKATKTEIDGALYGYGMELSFATWRDGTGTRGTVSAYDSGTGTITLTEPTEIRHFQVGMRLELKTSGGVLLVGSARITAINEDAGTMVVTLLDGAANPAATNTLARYGDYTASGSNTMTGVLGWIPTSAPSATLFFGVNRTLHVSRLSGVRFTGSSANIAETTFHAMARHAAAQGEHDHLFVNPITFAQLQTQAYAKGWIGLNSEGESKSTTGRGGKVTLGFHGFKIPSASAGGSAMVIPDPWCPAGKGLLTKLSSWELSSAGENPRWEDADGQRMRVSGQSDSVEGRLKGYLNLLCHRPIDNCLITFA